MNIKRFTSSDLKEPLFPVSMKCLIDVLTSRQTCKQHKSFSTQNVCLPGREWIDLHHSFTGDHKTKFPILANTKRNNKPETKQKCKICRRETNRRDLEK